jgi:hypothetical protein
VRPVAIVVIGELGQYRAQVTLVDHDQMIESADRSALRSGGHKIDGELEVLILPTPDRPGELSMITRRLADASVNVPLVYLATQTRVVIGVDDITQARQVLMHGSMRSVLTRSLTGRDIKIRPGANVTIEALRRMGMNPSRWFHLHQLSAESRQRAHAVIQHWEDRWQLG